VIGQQSIPTIALHFQFDGKAETTREERIKLIEYFVKVLIHLQRINLSSPPSKSLFCRVRRSVWRICLFLTVPKKKIKIQHFAH
jgi:hypothetical protein